MSEATRMKFARMAEEAIDAAFFLQPREDRPDFDEGVIVTALMAAAREADEAATKRAVAAVDAQISEYQTEQKQRRSNRETTEAFAAGEAIIALASAKAAILRGEA